MSSLLDPDEVATLGRIVFPDFDESGRLPEEGWCVEPIDVEEQVPPSAPEQGTTTPDSGEEPEPPPCAPPAGISEEDLAREVREAEERGRRAGIEEAARELRQGVDALTGALEEVSGLRERLLARNSDDMARLIMGIARQVLDLELAMRPEAVLETVRKGLAMAVQSDTHHVFVNPADLELVLAEKPLFLAGVTGLKNIVVEADPAVGRGGCRLVSDLGEVDATLERRLEELEATLRNGLEQQT